MYPSGGISASIYANRLRSEGMGSKDQAVPFSNQDYEALKQECLESGCLFEDPCFPAEPPSLGFKELAPYSSKTRDVVWTRPTVRKLWRNAFFPPPSHECKQSYQLAHVCKHEHNRASSDRTFADHCSCWAHAILWPLPSSDICLEPHQKTGRQLIE